MSACQLIRVLALISCYGNDFSENLDDLVRTDDRVRVIRNIDFERGVHLRIRVTGGGIFDHRHFLALFG